MNKYITEFIGTFFLVTVVGLTAVTGLVPAGFAPIAIGSVLMVMIYAGGHISGGHYNPAVTLAVLMRGKISMGDAVPYWISQFAAGVAAWAVVSLVFGGGAATASDGVADTTKALFAEILGTFALAYVVLNVATAKGTAGNSNYGLAIGFTVLCCAYAFGSFSGGAFNPAVAVGVTLMKGMAWANIWVYLLGCFGGAALAALVFNINNPGDK